MEENNLYLTDFLICFLKCFFVFLVFGKFLPEILDFLLYRYIEKISIYDNSVLVYNMIKVNKNILYNYIYIFNEFIKL